MKRRATSPSRKKKSTKRSRSPSPSRSVCTKATISSNARAMKPAEVQQLQNHPTFMNNYKLIENVQKQLNCPTTLFNAETLKATIEQQMKGNIFHKLPQDYEQQLYLQCFTQHLFGCCQNSNYNNPDFIQVLTSQTSKYFKLKKIAQKLKFGLAFQVFYGSMKKPFGIMKFAKQEGQGEIVHEIAIGYVLNYLRQYIPSFAYMYGGFYCNRQAANAKVLSCQDAPALNMIVAMNMQQFVFDGDELEAQKHSIHTIRQMMISVFLQVAHALNVAQKAFKYMHFDLHGSNVLVRKIPSTRVH